MSNDKVVRPVGYYLARCSQGSDLEVVYINQDEYDGFIYNEVHWCGSEVTSEPDQCYWIADEPLDLECIKLLQMNGGLQNAVELVKKGATIDIQQVGMPLNKRLNDAINHVKSLSKEEFAKDIYDAGGAGVIVIT